MTGFDKVLNTDPPRLVIQFRRAENGDEQFQWGVVHNMPIVSLIGHIVRVQQELISGQWMQECGESALVIMWDEVARNMQHFIHPQIPTTPLLGMLEIVKGLMVQSRLAQQQANNRTQIVGPNGQPFPIVRRDGQ